MNSLAEGVALFLLLNLLAALVRVARGPTAADRMLAALLFGTTGVGVLLLLAHAGATPALVDVALTLALLAAIAGVAFARRAWYRSPGPYPKGSEVLRSPGSGRQGEGGRANGAAAIPTNRGRGSGHGDP